MTADETKAQEAKDIVVARNIVGKMRELNLMSHFENKTISFDTVEIKAKDTNNRTFTAETFRLSPTASSSLK